MPKIWVKQAGAWKQVQQLWVNKQGVWSRINTGLITQGGVGKQFYPDTAGAVTYYSGSGTYTVPAGVYTLNVTMIAAGGNGGGGADWGSGAGGSGGYYSSYSYAVTPGSTISYSVGGHGVNTTFGTLTCTPGGDAPSGSSTYTAGAAGSPSGTAGQVGNQSGSVFPAKAGTGANSPFGTGGAGGIGGGPSVTGNPGAAATGFGAGGGGGGNNQGGGNGSPAFITIRATGSVVFGDATVNRSTATRAGAAYSWTVPAGITSITVNAAGGGGPGWAWHDGGYGEHAWTGGPGGGVQNLIIPVVPGDVISGVYGDAGGCGYYNGGQGGAGSATTIKKNGTLIATCNAGGGGSGQPGAPGTSTITSGYTGTTKVGTGQPSEMFANDWDPPYSQNHYDAWSWVLDNPPGYAQSVLGTVAVTPPSSLGTNYLRAGMGQVCGWVYITW